LVRSILDKFPNNVMLIQLFASLNNLQMFASIYRSRIQSIARLRLSEVDPEVIQAAGEELGDMLGRILEARINASNIRARLESL